MNKVAKWTIKDIYEISLRRKINKFDSNIAVSGDRGNGKSTFINKLFLRSKGQVIVNSQREKIKLTKFNPWDHQVYSRPDVIKLLKSQYYGLCWDDEAINSGYKRNFQSKGQQELIKILTAYRDNYNTYASAIPNFFNLDKDLRDLYFIHVHILERGLGVLHMPIQGRLYSQDRWDAKYNSKIEETWSKKMMKDPDFIPPYHKLSTFRGYVYFGDLTPKQREIYEKVKKIKRSKSFQTEEEKNASEELSFMDKVYNQLISRKLTRDGLIQICLMEDKKYSTVNSVLNRMLRDKGEDGTVMDFLRQSSNKEVHSNVSSQINEIIPSF